MKFLEKDLETIIVNHLEGCRERGLNIEPMEKFVFQQLILPGFGVADIVHIGYHRADDLLHIRIIECKRDVVCVDTYTQACRYQSAIKKFLKYSGEVFFEKILIGKRVDGKGDFWHLIAQDQDCRVFTFDYGVNGIAFRWRHEELAIAEAHRTNGSAQMSQDFTAAISQAEYWHQLPL